MDTGLLIVSIVFLLTGIGLIVSAYKAYRKFKFFVAAKLQSIDYINEMGESYFKKSKKPVHVPEDLIPYDGSLLRSKYDYLFGDAYIPTDSEIIVVGSAEQLADNRFQIRKKPTM